MQHTQPYTNGRVYIRHTCIEQKQYRTYGKSSIYGRSSGMSSMYGNSLRPRMCTCTHTNHTQMVVVRRIQKPWDTGVSGALRRNTSGWDKHEELCTDTKSMHGWIHLSVKRRQSIYASRMAPPATASPYDRPDPSCRASTGTPPGFMSALYRSSQLHRVRWIGGASQRIDGRGDRF